MASPDPRERSLVTTASFPSFSRTCWAGAPPPTTRRALKVAIEEADYRLLWPRPMASPVSSDPSQGASAEAYGKRETRSIDLGGFMIVYLVVSARGRSRLTSRNRSAT